MTITRCSIHALYETEVAYLLRTASACLCASPVNVESCQIVKPLNTAYPHIISIISSFSSAPVAFAPITPILPASTAIAPPSCWHFSLQPTAAMQAIWSGQTHLSSELLFKRSENSYQIHQDPIRDATNTFPAISCSAERLFCRVTWFPKTIKPVPGREILIPLRCHA